MTPDFDLVTNRLNSDSKKWNSSIPGVIPLSFADMDFRSAKPVMQALRNRVDHGIYGYLDDTVELQQVFAERLQQQFNWAVVPEAVVVMPEVIPGFNLASHALTIPGEGVLVQTPAYPPILRVHNNCQLDICKTQLTLNSDGRYEIDWDEFEHAITPRTRIFVLCNPQNPVGRAYNQAELEKMADICLQNNVKICSDEVWCDLVFDGANHIPIASLDPEIASQTITLMSPNKAFNLGGLKVSMAIIQDEKLRAQFLGARMGLASMSVNVMGAAAALAAYRDGAPWLAELLSYLETNRNYLCKRIADRFDGITMTTPEATYLGWLDCRDAGIPENPTDFFLQRARVSLVDGALFGTIGEGFIRLNFGCPRAILAEALERMERVLEELK